ncbi:MAG: lipocalin family protein [Bacteroidia bacterium]
MFFSCRHKELKTVDFVDLNKYSGRWYEIATIPISAQRGCSCTFAEYTVTEKGYVKVYNQCKKGNATDSITGKAFVKKGSGNSKLKVQFFWPFRADYYIIGLDENYQWAIVGHPSRNYLWFLSRTPKISEELYQQLERKATDQGFDVKRLVRTAQECN